MQNLLLLSCITTLLLCFSIIVKAVKNEFKKQKLIKECSDLAKEANEHITAYKEKKMIEYYKTINQGVVSLPEFIEAKKAMQEKSKDEQN